MQASPARSEELLTRKEVLAIIERAGELEGLTSGNCAMFAIALARVLGPSASVVTAEDSSQPGFICHAAVLYRGRLYDANGATTRRNLKVWAEGESADGRPKLFTDSPSAEFEEYAEKGTSCSLSVGEVMSCLQGE